MNNGSITPCRELPKLYVWKLYTNSRWYWIKAYDADAAYDVAMVIMNNTENMATDNRVTGFCLIQEND